MKNHFKFVLPLAFLMAAGFNHSSHAVTYTEVTYDETLFQADQTLDASKLIAKVYIGIEDNCVFIKLQNISEAGSVLSGSAAGGISGVAINLGNGTITGGSVTPIGTQSPSPWDLDEANSQWGWRQGSIGTGGLSHADYTYNAEASTMNSDTDFSFNGNPNDVDGLNYYAYSTSTTPVPGSPYVVDTIEIKLILDDIGSLTVDDIDNANIAVIFGSATATCCNNVPDGGATSIMLGLSMLGLGFFSRRKI